MSLKSATLEEIQYLSWVYHFSLSLAQLLSLSSAMRFAWFKRSLICLQIPPCEGSRAYDECIRGSLFFPSLLQSLMCSHCSSRYQLAVYSSLSIITELPLLDQKLSGYRHLSRALLPTYMWIPRILFTESALVPGEHLPCLGDWLGRASRLTIQCAVTVYL